MSFILLILINSLILLMIYHNTVTIIT